MQKSPDNRLDKSKGGICHQENMDINEYQDSPEVMMITQIPSDFNQDPTTWTAEEKSIAESFPQVPYFPPLSAEVETPEPVPETIPEPEPIQETKPARESRRAAAERRLQEAKVQEEPKTKSDRNTPIDGVEWSNDKVPTPTELIKQLAQSCKVHGYDLFVDGIIDEGTSHQEALDNVKVTNMKAVPKLSPVNKGVSFA